MQPYLDQESKKMSLFDIGLQRSSTRSVLAQAALVPRQAYTSQTQRPHTQLRRSAAPPASTSRGASNEPQSSVPQPHRLPSAASARRATAPHATAEPKRAEASRIACPVVRGVAAQLPAGWDERAPSPSPPPPEFAQRAPPPRLRRRPCRRRQTGIVNCDL